MNNLFERSLCEEEIQEIPEQKLELLPSEITVDILHPNYIPPGIKQEIEDVQYDTSNIIGTVKNLPGPLAKDVKQEIIDSTFHDISQCHSESCEIIKYQQIYDGVVFGTGQ